VAWQEPVDLPLSVENTYFRKIPRNIRSFEVSSGGFSAAVAGFTDDSEALEGADEAGEASKEPEDAEAIAKCCSYKINRIRDR
jgi:hypothetical protein